MKLDSAKKQELFSKHGAAKTKTDTGSPESQIALFTHRINSLTETTGLSSPQSPGGLVDAGVDVDDEQPAITQACSSRLTQVTRALLMRDLHTSGMQTCKWRGDWHRRPRRANRSQPLRKET